MKPIKKHAHNIDTFRQLLQQKKLRATEQRLAVHRAMMALGHASADSVEGFLRQTENVKIAVASVYNILTQLADEGIYSRRYSSNNKMYFDVDSGSHLHIYDTRNNEFKNVMDNELNEFIKNILRKHRFKGYKVDSVDIQFICHPTRRKELLAK